MTREVKYTPNPIDTNDVELPKELMSLVEVMAENVHEEWAHGRMGEGWVYGPERSDVLKQHPCLIPYADLSDDERNYDRKTALSTLKLIRKLGYKIVADEESM